MDKWSNIKELFSWKWFSLSQLESFNWENGFILYLIPAIPFLLFLKWGFYFRFRQKLDVALKQEFVKNYNLIGLLRFVPYLFFVLFIAMLLTALARPQIFNERVEVKAQGVDIILALDISESMQLEDLKPNRLEASKKVASDFISGREGDRIGIVLFAGEAFSLCPLTTDYPLLQKYLREANFDMIETPGTAIGSAIGISINRLRETNSKSSIMILITDGENNAGPLDATTAAKLAKAYGIKIYTIGIGRGGKIQFGTDESGNPAYVVSHLDVPGMVKIADITSGKFFAAGSNLKLAEIFKEIDKSEKREIAETRFKDNKDYYHIYLSWGLVFFLIWLLLKNTFMSNALED